MRRLTNSLAAQSSMPGDVWEVTLRHSSRVVAGALEGGLKQSEVDLPTQKYQMTMKTPKDELCSIECRFSWSNLS